jgi:hypothetical protein
MQFGSHIGSAESVGATGLHACGCQSKIAEILPFSGTSTQTLYAGESYNQSPPVLCAARPVVTAEQQPRNRTHLTVGVGICAKLLGN